MNGTSLFIFIPLILTISRISGLNVEDLLILTTIGVNVGSALTPIGNPQNIILWQYFHVGFVEFIAFMLPFAMIGLALLTIQIILTVKGGCVGLNHIPPIRLDRKLLLASTTLLILVIVLSQFKLQILALIITFIVLLIVKRDIIWYADYVLILIFTLMFIDFGELSKILQAHHMISRLHGGLEALLISSGLSQVISNVPATITLIGNVRDWRALALGVNVGGTGFIIGSLANLITLRLSNVRVSKFLKHSIPYFIALLSILCFTTYLKLYP